MGPELVRVVTRDTSEHVREGQLLEAGVVVHLLSLDPSRYAGSPFPAGPSPVQLNRSTPRWVRVGGLSMLGVGALLALILMLLTIAQAGRVLPGTSVVGVDVGGRDAWGARRILAPALEREQQRLLAVSIPGERILVRPVELGLTFDVDTTAAAALERGRVGALAPAVRLTAPLVTTSIPPRGVLDEARLADWVDTLAERVDREAGFGDLTIGEGLDAVAVVAPNGTLRIDREESITRLRRALLSPDVSHVELAVEVSLPPPTRPALEQLASRVQRAIVAPITLHDDGRRLTVDPATLVELLEVRIVSDPEGTRPELAIDRIRAQRVLGSAGRRTFDRGASDAIIVTPDLPPLVFADLSSARFTPVVVDVDIDPGERRTSFSAERAARQLVDMVMAGARSAEADLLTDDPGLTTEAALAGRPTHLLGTFTTFHPAGAPRTANIRLLADLLDGSLVAPGGEFSINRTSGPRRCEDGFVPAGTIIRGELVDTCGGGVSQLGTTLMNAAFFAGLPLEQWQPHSFFISRYPAGREATLNFPELDVRFANDTDGFVVVRTSHTPDSITVSLYGVPRWSEVRADHGERRAPTDFSEVVRTAPDLAPGARRVVQSGGGGFTIAVARTRTPLDAGTEVSVERWTTVYRPQQRIVEVGAAPVSPGVAPGGAAPPAAGGAVSDG